uniref:Uncharacterized protein n=1 Tax=Triticum urartu TaxID=4572 RepID=A0A8R7QCC2_TRIUA
REAHISTPQHDVSGPFLAPNSGDDPHHELGFYREAMALTNLILTVVGVGAAVMLLRKDVKQSSAVFRRNIRHIKTWLEEESAATTMMSSYPW